MKKKPSIKQIYTAITLFIKVYRNCRKAGCSRETSLKVAKGFAKLGLAWK
jgi:hypothetical protein